MGITKGILKWMAKHPFASTVTGFGLYGVSSGKGIGKTAIDFFDFVFNPSDSEGSVMERTVRTVVDGTTGDGNLDALVQKAGHVTDDLGHTAKEAGASVRQIKENVSGEWSPGNLIGNMFGGLMNGVKGLFGGGGGGLNLGSALLLPLAWFMFGKFGWLGKVGGVGMLMYALSHLFTGREPAVQVSQGQVESRVSDGGRALVAPKERFDELSQAGQGADGQEYNVRSSR